MEMPTATTSRVNMTAATGATSVTRPLPAWLNMPDQNSLSNVLSVVLCDGVDGAI